MAKYKVVMTDDRHKDYNEEKGILGEIGAELIIADCRTEDELIDKCSDADGILLNLAPMTDRVIGKLEKCRIISRYGVGYDNVDVEACSRKGIYVANVPDYCAEEVSDQALALLMGCTRKIARRDAQVRNGEWNILSRDPIHRMTGKVFAFLGFGTIARCLHRKIKGFNFARIMVYDPYVGEETIISYGACKAEWEDVFREADYISVHMPLNDETRGCIGREEFQIMKISAILVNTSRGPLVDEEALVEALRDGRINSAGLDVHSKEPLDMDNPLIELENCVLSDHVGWYSEESISELKEKTALNIKDVLLGGKPRYPVNRV